MKRLLLALLCVAPAILPAMAQIPAPPPPSDLKTPPSTEALPMKVLAPGTGTQHPNDDDFVHVRYAVWKASNGSVIDYTRTTMPAFVQMSKLLPGMRQMFEAMTPGERRRAWISSELGAGKIAAGETFVVEGELVDIVPPPTTPPDVAAPPADATVTKSGLAYKILQPGSGTVHPKRSSTVKVNYTGWTSDGKMFDTSVVRDEPAEFPLDAVIPGWTEGLELMTEGEKARFWIPGNLAYKNEPGKPHGMLVFDVELVRIK
ncbi:MAG TPA: FKBP-type peptidyl-prolyl cis-trans isomerase [Thermoanaerobaculia bacterium]|nr:FKBP-type peptidyl-prolyl cis-trans isomerase [Thermoanaerobaculia bacterium]